MMDVLNYFKRTLFSPFVSQKKIPELGLQYCITDRFQSNLSRLSCLVDAAAGIKEGSLIDYDENCSMGNND